MPTPVVPSQAGAIYRGGMMGGMRSRVDPLRLSRRARPDINPIYFAPEFRPYRDKQDQKDPNEKQIWPRVLEDAFLDCEFRLFLC
jgi:transcriptional enhancer factor